MGFPGGSDGKESACNAGGLENSVDRGAVSYLFVLIYIYETNQNLPYTDTFQSFLIFHWGVFHGSGFMAFLRGAQAKYLERLL